jgi:nucleoside 2-deoxyribosyltransferase
MFLVYLAGPITGLSYDDSTEWRQHFIDNIPDGVAALSPLRGKKYLLKDEKSINHSYEDSLLATQRAIYARDRFDCTRADVVVANLLDATKVSIGTVMEIAWAADNNIPVVLIMEDSGNVHDHPMIREACAFRTNNVDDAIHVTYTLLMPSSQA